MYGVVRLDPVELDKSRERLLLARSWDFNNPVIPEYLGQIEFMRAEIFSFSPAMQASFLREAIGDFDSAIALRPNSSYLWASRMTAGSRLLEADAKLAVNDAMVNAELSAIQTALRRAAALGPFEPRVLRQLISVGKLRYLEFSPENRSVIDAAVIRAKQLKFKI